MLQVARLSRKQLDDSGGLVVRFTLDQMNSGGGFRNREGKSDLYYTVFGVESLVALSTEVPSEAVAAYLHSFGDGLSLDFVHLACLARAWANLPAGLRTGAPLDTIQGRIEAHRTTDGGYNTLQDASHGTVYACFLALGAYQDLELELPAPLGIIRCIDGLRAHDGGYANQPGMAEGSTPATAAAATLLRHFEQPEQPGIAEWLLSRCRPEGGFFATARAPIPDLLSTATALHALSGLHVPLHHLRESCLDFIDTLWTNSGGFYGSWADDAADCEYTYYALLALGHLSL
jgi:prenyltransferase beta subunit